MREIVQVELDKGEVDIQDHTHIVVYFLGIPKIVMCSFDVADGAKNLSSDELKRVLLECETQIEKLGPHDKPQLFNKMVEDLKRVVAPCS